MEQIILGYEYHKNDDTNIGGIWYGLRRIEDTGRYAMGYYACVDVVDGKFWGGARWNAGLEFPTSARVFDTFEEAAEYAKKLLLKDDPESFIICQSKDEEEKYRLLI
jgi:hypothetical protein